jgi:purine nucleoside phosphorylase
VPVKIVLDEQPEVQRVLGPGMSAVPEVQVASEFGAAVKVILVAAAAILIVIAGAAWWIHKVRRTQDGERKG